ncbi:MAG: YbdK family carboxylate-amine ligase [Desulfofustis sp. PB-SRB1]|jgi:carboxylate-amine ligase|nr:YbdK family carboxylate-amine ligase [Desulfofustis sp. PB-SRB1]MBM1001284.1 YbdK family carboxylate-amine ligase [Desulfofustis sp. PB-SRB1]HBH29188.1 YbdK family carboxylate-amine ligase [Desulfofustis sp.]
MKSKTLQFNSTDSFSLGVEIEFQILAKSNFALSPRGPILQASAPAQLQPRIAPEFITSILEIQTGVCPSVRAVENDLLQTCTLMEELADEHECILFAASLHPFARAAEQQTSQEERYQRIMEELQLIGRRFITQGLHIHVGLADGDTAVRVNNLLQAYLPLFLALSCSSPFFEGEDTGLLSYRTKLFESLPMAGIYPYVENWRAYSEEIHNLIHHGIIESPRDLWWDCRPNYRFGTVEIRICDLPCRFSDILALVALIQSTVAWLGEEVKEARPLRLLLLSANKWQAVRHGSRGRFVDPLGLLGTENMSVAEAIRRLRDRTERFCHQLGGDSYLDPLDTIITRGTGAELMRRSFAETNDFVQVIGTLHKGFWQ